MNIASNPGQIMASRLFPGEYPRGQFSTYTFG